MNLHLARPDPAVRTRGGDFEHEDELMQVLRQSFRPSSITRIDEIIVSSARLIVTAFAQITRLLLEKTSRRRHARKTQRVEFHGTAVELPRTRASIPSSSRRSDGIHNAWSRTRLSIEWFSSGAV